MSFQKILLSFFLCIFIITLSTIGSKGAYASGKTANTPVF